MHVGGCAKGFVQKSQQNTPWPNGRSNNSARSLVNSMPNMQCLHDMEIGPDGRKAIINTIKILLRSFETSFLLKLHIWIAPCNDEVSSGCVLMERQT